MLKSILNILSRFTLIISFFIGIAVSILVKNTNLDIMQYLEKGSNVITNIFYYFFYPFLSVSIILAIYEFCREYKFSMVFQIIITNFINTFLISFVFLMVVIFLPFNRLPISNFNTPNIDIPSLYKGILSVIPKNIFNVFLQQSIFPLIFLSMVLGFFLEKQKYMDNIVDILSSYLKLFTSISEFFIHIGYSFFGFVVFWYIQKFKIEKSSLAPFSQILTYSFLFSAIIIFLFIPIYLFIILKKNSFKTFYYILQNITIAFFSKDVELSMIIALKENKNFFRYKREFVSLSYPLSFMFSKTGTILISFISFIAILKTFTKIEIGIFDYLQIYIYIFLICSFFAIININTPTYLVLILLVSFYKKSIDSSNILILYPALFILDSIAAMINSALALTISSIVAKRNNIEENSIISYF